MPGRPRGFPLRPSGRAAAPAPRRPAEVVRWFLARVAAAVAAILVAVIAAGFVLAHQASGPSAAWARSTGHDGLWLGHAWLTGGRSSADRAALTARIKASGISDVYVLAGQLDAAGRLSPSQYAGARAFLGAFRAALPHVHVCAWLSGTVGAGHLNLDDAATQRGIVASAAAALSAGFSGISYDLAPVASGDTGLLSVLAATRKLHPAVLSVDTPKLEPLSGMELPAALLMGQPVFWTASYLGQVASQVTQVAVLGFGTGMPLSSWYSGDVAHETAVALRTVPPGVSLVMGVPAFGGSTLGYHGSAETVAATIHGIRVGLTGSHQPRAAMGVGLYTADTATAQDWSGYQSGWVHPPGGTGSG